MKKNVGTYDAFMRITGGLLGLAWGTSRMIRYPHRGLPVFVTMMSAMKVAEGVTRWCPLLDVLKTNTLEDDFKMGSKSLRELDNHTSEVAHQ